MIELPPAILAEVDALVAQGAYRDRATAVADLVRLGLDALRSRAPRPPLPPRPPGRSDPTDDRPISVDPSDVNWMGGGFRQR